MPSLKQQREQSVPARYLPPHARRIEVSSFLLKRLLGDWLRGVTPTRDDVETILELAGTSRETINHWAEKGNTDTPVSPLLHRLMETIDEAYYQTDYSMVGSKSRAVAANRPRNRGSGPGKPPKGTRTGKG